MLAKDKNDHSCWNAIFKSKSFNLTSSITVSFYCLKLCDFWYYWTWVINDYDILYFYNYFIFHMIIFLCLLNFIWLFCSNRRHHAIAAEMGHDSLVTCSFAVLIQFNFFSFEKETEMEVRHSRMSNIYAFRRDLIVIGILMFQI